MQRTLGLRSSASSRACPHDAHVRARELSCDKRLKPKGKCERSVAGRVRHASYVRRCTLGRYSTLHSRLERACVYTILFATHLVFLARVRVGRARAHLICVPIRTHLVLARPLRVKELDQNGLCMCGDA